MNEITWTSSPKMATVLARLAGGANSERPGRRPARPHRNIGKRGYDVFDREYRREDVEKWGYQRRAQGGMRKHQTDRADAEQCRIGRQAKDVACPFCDAGNQGERRCNSDADTQWLHDGQLASLERAPHGTGFRRITMVLMFAANGLILMKSGPGNRALRPT